ncbi:synaptotagmin-like protein 4 isoform X3 [Tubulanus polymorphus]|uniref:synaptotagmin-like protein 4 isoform X3 n=1 Tax=Tubulanus polymorphus TaxID=672921 RepID=UPI003DA534DE
MDALIDLSYLCENERAAVISVLQRDQTIKNSEQSRLQNLKRELNQIRLKSVIKPGEDPAYLCARCRAKLGVVFHRGEICPKCHNKICTNCKYDVPIEKRWLCRYCFKQRELELLTGNWFYLSIQRRHSRRKKLINAPDLVNASLHQRNSRRCKQKDEKSDVNVLGGISQEPSPIASRASWDGQEAPSQSANSNVSFPSESDQRDNAVCSEPASEKLGTVSGVGVANDACDKSNNLDDNANCELKDHNVLSNDKTDFLANRQMLREYVQVEDRDPEMPDISESESENDSKALSNVLEQLPGPTMSRHSSRGNYCSAKPDVGYLSVNTMSGEGFEVRINSSDMSDNDHSEISHPESGYSSTLSSSHQDSGSNVLTPGLHIESGSGSTVVPQQTDHHSKQPSDASNISLPCINVTEVEDSGDHAEDIDRAVESHKAQQQSSLLSTSQSHGSSPSSRVGSSLGSRESVYSFYSDAGEGLYGTIPVEGEILFSLDYNYKTGVFIINIKQCRGLALVDEKRRRTDPYVKCYLLPDKTRNSKRKTRVKKHTINPVYDEQLKYNITKSELESRTLWISVWHNDRLGRNAFLGEVTINMDYFEFKDPVPQWHQLEERSKDITDTNGTLKHPPMSYLAYKGDLILAIKYVTQDQMNITDVSQVDSNGELHVCVKAARNLTSVRANGTSDPFCKGYLLPDKKRTTKQKTPVIKHNCNPEWNILMKFEDIAHEELKDKCVELTIWDYDRIGSNQFLGGIRLNLGLGITDNTRVDWMDARGEEIAMWQNMMSSPNTWIEGSLNLRPNMDRRV